MGEIIAPHSPTHERLVLGAILVGANGFELLLDCLHEKDFYPSQSAHARIFRTMCALRERGQTIDHLSVYDVMQADGTLEAIGGIAYLAGLADGLPRVAPLRQWAYTLREYSRRREIIARAELLRERALDLTSTTSEILDSAIGELGQVAVEDKQQSDDGISPFDADITLLSELRDEQQPKIYTGIRELDSMLGGFQAGELWIAAAATGVGKSLFVQQVRRLACARGFHSVVANAEMSAVHLQRRELARAAEVPQGKMRVAESITPEEFRRLVNASANDCKTCRLLCGELDIPRIRSYARFRKQQSALSLLIIDYDELVTVDGETENDQARILAREAKAIGMANQVPVILVSQLRKALAGEDLKRPTLQSIYGSGAKTKHATGVLLIDRPWVRELDGDETDATLFVLKNRDGRLGRIPCRFDIHRLEFFDGQGSRTTRLPSDPSLFRNPAVPREVENES
jgi:replicative DNA helicase